MSWMEKGREMYSRREERLRKAERRNQKGSKKGRRGGGMKERQLKEKKGLDKKTSIIQSKMAAGLKEAFLKRGTYVGKRESESRKGE